LRIHQHARQSVLNSGIECSFASSILVETKQYLHGRIVVGDAPPERPRRQGSQNIPGTRGFLCRARRLANENPAANSPKGFNADLNTLLNSSDTAVPGDLYKDFVYYSSSPTTTPDLSQVRGKLVIDSEAGLGTTVRATVALRQDSKAAKA